MPKIVSSKSQPKTRPEPEPQVFSLVSNEKLIAIHTAMIKCRMVAQRATTLFQQGKLASDLHGSSGREAASTGIAIDLLSSDTLSPLSGDWLPAFVKGLPLDTLFRIVASPAKHPGGEIAATPPDLEQKNILASDEAHRPQLVCERAIATQAAKKGDIVAAVLPSAEQSLQPWHSILAAAASKRLPLVCVHYASGASRPTDTSGQGKAKNPNALFHGVPAIAVDANDAVAVYRVAYEAIIRARQGRGATLIECLSHPNTSVKENENEASAAGSLSADPLLTMATYLKSKGIEPQQDNHDIVAAFNRDLDLATRFLDQ
jgi:TPP-dependent pyruvate/acetoin dehydrogenase alpha subunit